MRITVLGRGNVGGGLADLWEQAGHQVTRLGRGGGDAADADVVVIAVPGGALADALEELAGAEGKVVIDTTNLIGAQPPAGFASNAHFVKSKTAGPTAKAFNLNFASLYGQLKQARARPSNLWCGDEEARGAVEQLSSDAGYDAVCCGDLEKAGEQEAFINLIFGVARSGLGQFVYRMAPPAEL